MSPPKIMNSNAMAPNKNDLEKLLDKELKRTNINMIRQLKEDVSILQEYKTNELSVIWNSR